MTELYYTPSIEEFHIGFEYELNNMMLRGTMAVKPPLEWYKYTFDNEKPYDLTFIKYVLENNINILRVKYLDKEDIESLGFSGYVAPREYDHTWRGFNIYILKAWFNRELPIVRIMYIDNIIIFNGIIKNKSELKTLLKQLQIL